MSVYLIQSYVREKYDFIKNPKPKSMGIANPELIAERQIISEVLNEKD